MHFTNEQLQNGLLEDDPEILCYFWQKTGPFVLGFIRRHSGTDTEARQYFNFAVLEARKNLTEGRYRDQDKLENYLFAIAKKTWLYHHRSLLNARRKEARLDERQHWIRHPDRTAEERIVFDEQLNLLHQALKKLDDKCRQLLHLYYFEQWDLSEIAEENAEKDGTVRKRHHDCKKKLKNVLK